MNEQSIEKLLEQVADKSLPVHEAVDILLQEMGRGGRNLMVDENLYGLEPFLSEMGYTVYRVQSGFPDDQIKKLLESRVFITKNGQHFSDPEDMQKFYYGLIWVKSNLDEMRLAEAVKGMLMTKNFGKNLTQIATV